MNLKNKIALVTGSSRGIGRETIIKLASLGADVIINYNNSEDRAIQLENELRKYNIKSLIVKCDISNEEEVIKMKHQIIEEFGRIDILVNNASIAIDTTFEDKNIDNFKRILDVNLLGTFLVSKHIGELMIENKNGTIINIASTNAIDTYYPESLDYDASKAGVISLTNNFAKQFAPFVRVNCVAPGWVNTEMNMNMDKELICKEEGKILLERFAEPSEISNVIAFLSSDEASYINGSVIRVDGGKDNG
ncbi:MAG: SDR family oxidoreductase [Bacilli bacterium]|nr:SDR family oxidoreductase [Bacilli bacterium]